MAVWGFCTAGSDTSMQSKQTKHHDQGKGREQVVSLVLWSTLVAGLVKALDGHNDFLL